MNKGIVLHHLPADEHPPVGQGCWASVMGWAYLQLDKAVRAIEDYDYVMVCQSDKAAMMMPKIREVVKGKLIYYWSSAWPRMQFMHPSILKAELAAVRMSDLILTPDRPEAERQLRFIAGKPAISVPNPINLSTYPGRDENKFKPGLIHMNQGSIIGSMFLNNLFVYKKLLETNEVSAIITNMKDENVGMKTHYETVSLDIERIFALGRRPWSEYIKSLLECELSLHLQYVPGGSRSVMESVALGIPVITAKSCTTGEELLSEFQVASLEDAYNLARTILGGKRSVVDEAMKKAYEKLEKKHSFEACKEHLTIVLEDLDVGKTA